MEIIFILCFPPFQSYSISSSENSGGRGHRSHTSTQEANSTVVANTHENSNSKPSGTATDKRAALSAKSTRLGSSSTPMSCIREQLESQGLSEQASALVMDSCWNSMNPTLRNGSSTAVKASVETGVNFLAELYHTGVGYTTINTARCALSTCLLIDPCKRFGSHLL